MKKIKKALENEIRTKNINKLIEQINPIPKHIRDLIEIQEKMVSFTPKFDLPKFDLPNLNFVNPDLIEIQEKMASFTPKFDLPKFDLPNLNFVNPVLLELQEKMASITSKFELLNSSLFESLNVFSKVSEKLKNNPEFQFYYISNLEILNLKSSMELKKSLTSDLTDENILEKEELLNQNLLPYLEELEIQDIWIGASKILESDNPDKLRYCLISLRTILEHLIDKKLAPMEELKEAEIFEGQFQRYHLGQQRLEFVRIKRSDKIKYFISKIRFGILEFTRNEIKFICDCYSILCNVHQCDVGLTENQVRSLKVKTGITIWLLAYINKILQD
ncbi:MAG: hypothetical protein AB8G11_03545 [Saprospiraceae bacterium]